MSAEQSQPESSASLSSGEVAASILRILDGVRKAQRSARHRVQYGHGVMSPMEEARWFNLAALTTIAISINGTNPTQLLAGNPMRVGLYVSIGEFQVFTTGSVQTQERVYLGPNSTVNANGGLDGFIIQSYVPTLHVSCNDFPGLIQGPWWVLAKHDAGGTHTLEVQSIEIILRDWPAECKER